jgi:hypothetical protein
MVCWHVECPFIRLDLEPWRSFWNEEGSDAVGITSFAMRSCKNEAVGCPVHSAYPHLTSIYCPPINSVPLCFDCMSEHVGCIRSVIRLGQSEGE